MVRKSKKQPGLAILARYARGKKDDLKYWSKFIENDPDSMAAVALLQRLDRFFESMEIARLARLSQRLRDEIFERFFVRRSSSGKAAAHLYYDSRAIPLPEGIRPSLLSERRMKFAAGKGRIELSIVPVFPGRFEITGRFENAGSSQPQTVRLKGRQMFNTRTDTYGFFSFAAVNPGTYQLHIGSHKQEVVVNDLIVR